jgi:GAF domain-containing protein
VTHEIPSRRNFAAIAERLRDGRSSQEIYDVIADRALQVVDGCDHAGIAVLDGDRFTTASASDDVVRLLDDLQREAGHGPCLEASTELVWQHDADLAERSEWPRWAPLVLARTPVRSALALPLVHDGRRSGALNLFADEPHAFSAESMDLAAVLASFASMAVAAAAERERADQFEEGMHTNREIGTAVGMLMATHQISQDQAFELLSSASQRLNRKLRDIAAAIVRGEQPGSG